MSQSYLRLSFVALVLTLLVGCGSGGKFKGPGAEGDFLHGKNLYENGRCFQAAEALQTFLSQHPGSVLVDEAIYYLGMSRKCLGEYILARDEFDRLLREFPQSEHREDAEWNRALCFHESRHSADRDPEPTEQAIRAFQAYRDHYPNGTYRAEADRFIRDSTGRLAKKAYENGKTYVMLRQYPAAAIYFAKSLQVQWDSEIAPKVQLALVKAYLSSDDVDAAKEAYQAFQSWATPETRARYGGELESALEAADRAIHEHEGAESDGDSTEQASGEGP